MLRIGLTGGIGAGKSTAAAELVDLGAVLIDADQIARDVVAAGTPGLAAVLAEFGPDVRSADGSLDRPALGRVVFTDDDARARLNAIVHPLVRRATAEQLAAVADDAIVVHDVPLIVEGGSAGDYDLVVVVGADEDIRIERLQRDRAMSEADARARIAAQATDEQRHAVADVWLDNTAGPDELREQVRQLWHTTVLPTAARSSMPPAVSGPGDRETGAGPAAPSA